MRALITLIVLGVIIVLVAVVAATASAPPGGETRTPGQGQNVSDVSQLDMLDADLRMLERMRASVSPNMDTMIEKDSMWVDPDMIRLHEEYQSQLDRMLGKRPGQP
jgi:hypothetical protein